MNSSDSKILFPKCLTDMDRIQEIWEILNFGISIFIFRCNLVGWNSAKATIGHFFSPSSSLPLIHRWGGLGWDWKRGQFNDVGQLKLIFFCLSFYHLFPDQRRRNIWPKWHLPEQKSGDAHQSCLRKFMELNSDDKNNGDNLVDSLC